MYILLQSKKKNCLYSTFHIPRIVPTSLQMLTHFIFTTLRGRFCYQDYHLHHSPCPVSTAGKRQSWDTQAGIPAPSPHPGPLLCCSSARQTAGLVGLTHQFTQAQNSRSQCLYTTGRVLKTPDPLSLTVMNSGISPGLTRNRSQIEFSLFNQFHGTTEFQNRKNFIRASLWSHFLFQRKLLLNYTREAMFSFSYFFYLYFLLFPERT